MIDFIRGKVIKKDLTKILVEVNGIGYGVEVPVSTYKKLIGEEVELYTYLYVKEDSLQLYGFSTEEERELFKSLISVSRVGPRLALGILSQVSVEDFYQIVEEMDVDRLSSLPGLGKKTAQRILLELKGRLVLPSPEKEELTQEAVKVLINLGCKREEAIKAVEKAKKNLPQKVNLEELIKESLKVL